MSLEQVANLTEIDFDSMICGDITMPEVQTNVFVYHCRATIDGFGDVHLLNPNAAAGGVGESYWHFTMPPGTSTATFGVPIGALAGTTSVKLVLYLDAGAQVLTSQRFTVSTTFSKIAISVSGLTPNTMYRCAIQVNDIGQQAVVLVGRCTLDPGKGTGTFANGFVRLRASPAVMSGTSHRGVWNTLFHEHDNQSELPVITDAASVASEVYGLSGSGLGNVVYLERGRVSGIQAVAAVNGGITIDDFAFPANRQERAVSVRHQGGGGGWNGTNRLGVFLRAIYLPVAAQVWHGPIASAKRLIIIGDSIAAGNLATNMLYQGWTSRVRQQYAGTTVVDAYGGRSFFTDGNTTALQKSFAQYIAHSKPSDVWVALGINDYVNAQWTAAAFGTAYAAWLDFLHTASPNTRVFCQSPIVKNGGVGANGAGSTLQQYRDQISTVATDPTRVAWCYYDDGLGGFYPASGDISGDNIHPTTDGHGKYGQAVVVKLRNNGVM